MPKGQSLRWLWLATRCCDQWSVHPHGLGYSPDISAWKNRFEVHWWVTCHHQFWSGHQGHQFRPGQRYRHPWNQEWHWFWNYRSVPEKHRHQESSVVHQSQECRHQEGLAHSLSPGPYYSCHSEPKSAGHLVELLFRSLSPRVRRNPWSWEFLGGCKYDLYTHHSNQTKSILLCQFWLNCPDHQSCRKKLNSHLMHRPLKSWYSYIN